LVGQILAAIGTSGYGFSSAVRRGRIFPNNLRNGRAMLRSVRLADDFSSAIFIASVIHPIEPGRTYPQELRVEIFLRRAVANIFCEESARPVAS
jgi:hypothetical protein